MFILTGQGSDFKNSLLVHIYREFLIDGVL